MDNFDEARNASEEMFSSFEVDENVGAVDDAAEDIPTDNPEPDIDTDVQNAKQVEQDAVNTADQAVTMAESAINTAAQSQLNFNQVLGEVEHLRQQNMQLQNLIQQMSQQQEEAIVEEMTGPTIPEIDLSALAFDDPDTVKEKQVEYARHMSDFVKNSLMSELAPVIDEVKAGIQEKERRQIFNDFLQIPQLKGISDMADVVDGILKNNPLIANSDAPLRDKYIAAYTIAKGVQSINTPDKPAPTAEELMGYYNSNSDFRDLVDKQRLSELQKGQQVPPMSASSGASSAALNIPEKPKTFEEASERTRHMFSPRR